MDWKRLLDEIGRMPGCEVVPPTAVPLIEPGGDILPKDIVDFYQHCGGIRLFAGGEYPVRVVSPSEFKRSNPAIAQEEKRTGDISDSWYIICNDDRGQRISIDCSGERNGKCYDSFWDVHAVQGSCRIVALSFPELMTRLVDGKGKRWYWLLDGMPSYGDAYGNSS